MKKNLIALGMCITLLLGGCSAPANSTGDTDTSAVTSADTQAVKETPEPAEEAEQTVSLGSKATLGDWKVTVKKASVKSRITNDMYYFKPGKGNKFIYITATVRNNGKEEDVFLPSVGLADKENFATLYYQDEYEYKPTNLLNHEKDLLQESIKPLTNKAGILVFEVPKKVAKKKGELLLKIGSEEEYVMYSLK